MGKHRSAEFRRDIVALIESGSRLADVCRDFGLPKQTVSFWWVTAKKAEGLPPDTSVDRRLREAQKKIRLLEQEAEVMRRAFEYLARGVDPK